MPHANETWFRLFPYSEWNPEILKGERLFATGFIWKLATLNMRSFVYKIT